MGKTSLLFSGQGSQYVGMGKELVESFPELKKIYELGSDVLGFDLQKAVNLSTESELSDTRISQPAIYAVSLIAFESLKKSAEDFEYQAVAGHSLGEYAAMTAAGILDYENGFKAIKIRSTAMSKAKGGGMAAVLWQDTAAIEQVCAEITGGGDYVAPVNYNSPQQTVIAGTEAGLEKAVKAISEKGARKIIKLNVSAAFHSKLMKDASEEFRENIVSVKFNAPFKDFYCNVYGKKLEASEPMTGYLARHIYSPVRFTDELMAMHSDGIDTYIELGPGKVLSGLVKKTLENVKTANAEDIKSLEDAKGIILK